MKNIKQYVNQKNAIAKLFGDTLLDLNNAADREVIDELLFDETSPENLTQDGELSPAQVARRLDFLNACVKELRKIDKELA
jgi:hypothetical protein